MEALTFEEKYQIILDKDPSYEGLFFTAVKSTGIFCRPSCTARKPKIENVVFYDSSDEALQNGFRPCKVCKPMQLPDETPEEIRSLLKELEENPMKKLKDQDLRERGLEPNTVRRWFKKHHQMTFQAYQRMLRINMAYQKIHDGKSVTSTAFESGFESLSGFNSSFKNIFKTSASQAEGKNIINIKRFSTPLGPMFACATEKGICLLEFTMRRMLETEFQDLAKRLDAVILPGPNPHLDQVEKEITEYFAKKRTHFDVSLHTPGTDFQNRVWNELLTIPYGQTRSYEEQAIRLGNVKAIRAVATANGHNRVAIIIPCHRVIGKDGSLTGYAGGLERKQWLLEHEGAIRNDQLKLL